MKRSRASLVLALATTSFLVAGLSSSAAEASFPQVASNSPASDESVPVEVTPDLNFQAERERISELMAPLNEFNGGSLGDFDRNSVTFMFTSAEAIEEAQKAVESIKTPLEVKFQLVEYTQSELEKLAVEFFDDPQLAEVTRILGGGYDPGLNRVIVEVPEGDPLAAEAVREIERRKDPRFQVSISTFLGVSDESRTADIAPFSGGAKIVSSTGVCTMGFTWTPWGSTTNVGSTARHCANLNWYNNGNSVGTVTSSFPGPDSAFITGKTYDPSVFVGGVNTITIRKVVGVDTSWSNGDAVAMSGATSGLNTAYVDKPAYHRPASCSSQGQAHWGVLMRTHVTAGGDSGGPWLTTLAGSGNAIAHGQHVGRGCVAGSEGSFFIRLTDISSSQQASIALYP